jgi:hypothetical protein
MIAVKIIFVACLALIYATGIILSLKDKAMPTQPPDRCTFCAKDTTYLATTEQGLCDDCNTPEGQEYLEQERLMAERFDRYYRNHMLELETTI